MSFALNHGKKPMKITRASKKVFGFKEQLSLGQKGEDLFIKSYPYLQPVKGNGSTNDIILNDGSTIEIKTDFYSMLKTGNMFIERFGNLEKKIDGGPWKALKDKNDFFVYLFYPDKTFFWFNTKRLVEYLNIEIKKGSVKSKLVRNQNYTTQGFAIEREKLFHLLFKLDRF